MNDALEPTPQTFEQALAELESIVDELEKGELSLEQSLGAFERGIGLTRSCQQALDIAEQRVRILTDQRPDAGPGDRGSTDLEAFEADD